MNENVSGSEGKAGRRDTQLRATFFTRTDSKNKVDTVARRSTALDIDEPMAAKKGERDVSTHEMEERGRRESRKRRSVRRRNGNNRLDAPCTVRRADLPAGSTKDRRVSATCSSPSPAPNVPLPPDLDGRNGRRTWRYGRGGRESGGRSAERSCREVRREASECRLLTSGRGERAQIRWLCVEIERAYREELSEDVSTVSECVEERGRGKTRLLHSCSPCSALHPPASVPFER